MAEKLIEFQNVSVSFANEEHPEKSKEVLKNINLSFHRGEFTAVLGHNGSGKSTLAKLCNAIYEPTTGDVLVCGMNTHLEENEDKVRRIVGMVFQNPDNQIVATIVEDDVAFGPENLGVEPKEIRRRVDEALKAVNMYDYRLREPHKLSGGQKQRVAVAGVLAMQTDCIIMDESTAMLDPLGRQEVFDIARRLNKEMGITVIFITHFMEEAVKADRVVVLNDGTVVKDGTPREVFGDAATLQKCGLDVPQSTALCNALGMQGTVLTPEECVDALLAMGGGAK